MLFTWNDFCLKIQTLYIHFHIQGVIHLELIAYVFPCFSHCQMDLHFFQRQRKNDVEKEAKVADKPEFHCPDCDKVFLYASRLHFHMKSHKSKKALLRKTQPVKTEVPAHTMHKCDLDV